LQFEDVNIKKSLKEDSVNVSESTLRIRSLLIPFRLEIFLINIGSDLRVFSYGESSTGDIGSTATSPWIVARKQNQRRTEDFG